MAKEKQIKKIESKYFVIFIKIFLVYLFFELFLVKNFVSSYTLVKATSDIMIILFIFFTIINLKGIKLYRAQKLSLIALFVLLAAISTLKNNLQFTDFLMGIRVLFRYYIIYFFSFYYDIKAKDFRSISNFVIRSFYVEIVLFLVNYLAFGKIEVLYNHYLFMAIYLNAVCALLLFQNRINIKNGIILSLIILQAFLSTSRLAVIAIMVQVLLFVFLIWKEKFLHKAIISLIITFLVILVFIFSPVNQEIINSETYAKLSSTQLDPETNFRFYLFTHFTELSVQNFNIIGDGPNTFGAIGPEVSAADPEYYYEYGFDDRTIAYSADSHYTVLLMSYGFIGLFLYYFIVYSLFRQSKPEYRKFLILFLSFIMIASFALPIFSIRISSFFMFIFFAFAHNTREDN